MNRFRLSITAFATAMLSVTAVGCDGSSHERVYTYVDTSSNGDDLLPPPFTAEETTALRTGFSWNATTAVPETDAEGRPTLFYAIILVADRDDADFLEIAEIYHSALPLFGDEMARWDSYGAGEIDPTGDDHGTFVFAILTGPMYNAFRDEALAGNAPFEAVILRTPPDATLVRPDGSLDFDRLVDGGFTYGYSEDAVASAAPLVGASTQPLLGRLARLVHRIVTFARNVVPWIAARVRPKREFTMRLRIVNFQEPFFDPSIPRDSPDFDNNILRSEWKESRPPVVPHGAKVEIRSALALTISRVDRNGQVRADIPNSERIRVVLRLKNSAAMITSAGLYERHTIISFADDGVDSRSANVHMALDLRDYGAHALSALTDTRDFASDRLGTDPRGAVVIDGFRDGGGASSTGCWTFFGWETTSFGHGRGWSIVGSTVGRTLADVDMVLRGRDGTSRGVPVHEYGHFLMCDMMYREWSFDFGRAYGEVVREVVADKDGPISPDSQARIVAEGWADFVSAEVVGATNYFQTFGASGANDLMNYCDSASSGLDPLNPCTDDNWGGPRGAFPGWVGRTGTSDRFPIGAIATTLVDAFDRPGRIVDAPNAAIRWTFNSHGAVAEIASPLVDETVELEGTHLTSIIASWSKHSNRLDLQSFFNAIADVSERHFGRDATCEMMALHEPTADCESIAPTIGPATSSPLPVFRLVAATSYDTSATSPVVTARWFALDSAATSVRVDVINAAGIVVATANRPSTASGSWTSSGTIPFDAVLRVVVTPLDGEHAGVSEERTIHTAPEVLRSFGHFENVGTVTLHWTHVGATSYRIVSTRISDGFVTTFNTTTSPFTISDFNPMRIQIFSVGSDGIASTLGSDIQEAYPWLE